MKCHWSLIFWIMQWNFFIWRFLFRVSNIYRFCVFITFPCNQLSSFFTLSIVSTFPNFLPPLWFIFPLASIRNPICMDSLPRTLGLIHLKFPFLFGLLILVFLYLLLCFFCLHILPYWLIFSLPWLKWLWLFIFNFFVLNSDIITIISSDQLLVITSRLYFFSLFLLILSLFSPLILYFCFL